MPKSMKTTFMAAGSVSFSSVQGPRCERIRLVGPRTGIAFSIQLPKVTRSGREEMLRFPQARTQKLAQ